MTLVLTDISETGIVLEPAPSGRGLWTRLRKQSQIDLNASRQENRGLAFALARVRSLDPKGQESIFRAGSLTLSHHLVASIEEMFAIALGLPPFVSELTFAATFRGTLGSPDARLDWHWERQSRPEMVPMQGALLFPKNEARRLRIPVSLLDAIKLAEKFDPDAPLEEHWRALSGFRTALGIADTLANPDIFLKDLRIVTVARIGIDIINAETSDFAPVPVGPGERDDARPVLSGAELMSFQKQVAERGALSAYRLPDSSFAVIESSAAVVLSVLVQALKADEETRRNFIANAPRLIEEALEEVLRSNDQLDEDTTPEQATELIESALDAGWVETDRWSTRVTGIGTIAPIAMEIGQGSGLPWLPDTLEISLGEVLGAILDANLEDVLETLKRAQLEGVRVVQLDIGDIPVQPDVIEALERRLTMRPKETPPLTEPGDAYLPLTHTNLHSVDYFEDLTPRSASAAVLPATVQAKLRPYQTTSFSWQTAAWKAGLPGVLNADEQGLGKTLQTLSFLAWLTDEMRNGNLDAAPILVVAPTSLLRNWQDEIERHLTTGALGPVHRFYGQNIQPYKSTRGRDIGDGLEHLDLDRLIGKIGVVVTSYQTLTNYAVSIAQLPFAVAVFDEMQYVKNPRTQRANAIKAVNAVFRIGLTGTPIENRTQDLWSVMDTIAPGALGALAGFNRVFASPSDARLEMLRRALFAAPTGQPPLCLRRTKEEADPTIPPKVRFFYPQTMPSNQAIRYDEARAKTGGILQVLQHIRRVSAHPGLIESEKTNDFIGASARTAATLDILRFIKDKRERALVFVESRDLQSWFAEILKIEFDLTEVMVINGDTSIDDRREITRRFQSHIEEDRGFDVLLLGPRAAGTGLTLTAANHVIHLTRWWNPAVEEQCNDRTHRIGQSRQVTIHLPLAVHPDLGAASFDCLLHRLIMGKRALAANVLEPSAVTEGDLKRLYSVAVAGQVVDDVPHHTNLNNTLPDRDDLEVTLLAHDIVRITGRHWHGGILVAANEGTQHMESFLSDDIQHVVAITPTCREISWRHVVPLSVVHDPRLWSEFILPI